MKVNTLTKPPFIQRTVGMWYIVRVDGPMESIQLPRQKDVTKYYPVTLYCGGLLPMPEKERIFSYLVRQGSKALLTASHALSSSFDVEGGVGSYYLLTYNGQKEGGGKKYNLWDVARLELDEAERTTLEGKE